MFTISIGAIKGGTGKTTLTYNLAGAILDLKPDANILLIDAEPQASLTAVTGASKEKTIIELLNRKADIKDVIQVCGDFFVIGSRLDLMGGRYKDTTLRDALKGVSSFFDYCLIDTSPVLSRETRNALIASDKAVVCVLPDAFAFQGISGYIGQCEAVKDINPDLVVDGVIINGADTRSVAAETMQDVLEAIEAYANDNGLRVYKPILNRYGVYRDSIAKQTPVVKLRPKCKASSQLRKISKEIMKER